MQNRASILREAVSAEKNDLRTSFEQQLRISPAEQRRLGILLYPLTIDSQDTQGSQTLIAFRTSLAINDTWFRKGCNIRCKVGEQSFDGRMQEISDHAGVFSLYDEDLPNLNKLQAVAVLGAKLVRDGHRVLSHCGMGFNRSALVAGLILHQLGMPGTEVVARLRERRPGALFNDRFAAYVESLTARALQRD